uniref:Uncharacterized protein n=1 Tax=Panagrolaimus sp. ES5 TaxID=591445 RepID=A0AC34GB95_9BILA
MSGVKGKDRLMLYTIRSAYVSFNFKGRPENELFREFANACNLTKYTITSGGNNYAHPPQYAT